MLCLACRLCFGMTAWQTYTEGRESLSALQSAADRRTGSWKFRPVYFLNGWAAVNLKSWLARGYDLSVKRSLWLHESLNKINLWNNLSLLSRDCCSESYDSDSTRSFTDFETQATNLLLTSVHLHVTQKRIVVFTPWSGLSSAINVMLRVFTWALNWTEIVHMSRMIHLLAWAHNPLHLRWIIYTTLPYTPPSWRSLSSHADVFLDFHLPDVVWGWLAQLLNIQSGSNQSRRRDSSISDTINKQVDTCNGARLARATHKNVPFPIPPIIWVVNEKSVNDRIKIKCPINHIKVT